VFRKRALDRVIRRSFVVTKSDGGMFRGALIEYDESVFVFAMVKAWQGDKWMPAADGPVYIDRSKVDYMQRISVDAAE
jgi:hypothetical protein